MYFFLKVTGNCLTSQSTNVVFIVVSRVVKR